MEAQTFKLKFFLTIAVSTRIAEARVVMKEVKIKSYFNDNFVKLD